MTLRDTVRTVAGGAWRLLTNRMVVFVIAGSLLFAIDRTGSDRDDLVTIGAAEIAMLEARWRAQTGTEATPREKQALIDEFIEEEVLSREAVRLGLDRGDIIVRRRLAQKMQLILREQAGDIQVTEAEVRAYIEENPDLFRVPARAAFRQVFLGPSRASAGELAEESLRALKGAAETEAWRAVGKPSMAPSQMGMSSHDEIAGAFGSDFAGAVLAMPAGEGWSGPVRSSYGYHLVSVDAAEAGHMPAFEIIQPFAGERLRRERAQAAEEAARRDLISQYRIVMDVPGP